VLVALFLIVVAGLAGYVVGRETADDDSGTPAVTSAAETTDATTTEATEPEGRVDGAEVFANAGCGSCHVFSKAGSDGQAGPPLDDVQLNQNEIEDQVRNGGAAMPAFGDRLSDAEIAAVAEYVASG